MSKMTEKDWNRWHWIFIGLMFLFCILEHAVDPVFRHGMLACTIFPMVNCIRQLIVMRRNEKRAKEKFQ